MSAVTPARVVARAVDESVQQAALDAGFSHLQSCIIAGRITAPAVDNIPQAINAAINPQAKHLNGPASLPDIEPACAAIADAVEQGKPIALVTDHDADGATSNAILRMSFISYGVPETRLHSYLSHRLNEGYGVSDALVDRMLPELPAETCIITADQGSTDEPRIARLAQAGHRVVVTDHHRISAEGPPASACAVVNPVRDDSEYPDKAIAGCHTALLVMAAVRDELIRRKFITASVPKTSRLFDICAVGTVADAVSLGESINNRFIVQHGLQMMNADNRACWRAFRALLHKEGDWTAEDLAFQMAPRINARGRIADAMLGVEFLCETDDKKAFEILQELDAANQSRKTIEKKLTGIASGLAEIAIEQGKVGLCLWLGDEGHSGVHGITASRIVDKYARPTVCLSPVTHSPHIVTGSIRTTEFVDVQKVLLQIQAEHPDVLISAGGHKAAGGLKLALENIGRLETLWDHYVSLAYGDHTPCRKIETDGELTAKINLHCLDELSVLEPYGRQFESPVFTACLEVKQVRAVGDGTHLSLKLRDAHGENLSAIWFSALEVGDAYPVEVGETWEFVFRLSRNTFRNNTSVQLMILDVTERQAMGQ